MALIKCPECAKEISDQASACIHCGYPLSTIKNEIKPQQNIVEKEHSIVSLFENFVPNSMMDNISRIYINVLDEVNRIKAENSKADAINIIAEQIIDGFVAAEKNCHFYPAVNLYSKFIIFDSLSPKTMDYVTERLYSIISIKFPNKEKDDWSYHNLFDFYYPVYMILEHGSRGNKAKLMSVLQEPRPFLGKKNGYEFIISEFNELGASTENILIDAMGLNKNRPTCPTCGSTNIKKISDSAKLVGALAFGLLSKTAKSQFKCNHCGYKW